MKEILYVKFSNERNDNYKIKTLVVKIDGIRYVEKLAASVVAKSHIINIAKQYNKLIKYYNSNEILINNCKVVDEHVQFEFVEGISFDKKLDNLLFEDGNYIGAINEVEKFFYLISDVKSRVPFKETSEFIQIFGNAEYLEGYDSFTVSNIDVAFSNVIINNSGYNLIDYEWVFDFPIPIKYVEYRAILNYVLDNPKRGIIIENGIFDKLGLTDKEISCFEKMEKNFQKYVYKDSFINNNFYKLLNVKNYNMVEYAEKLELESFKYITDIFFDYGNGIVPESVISLNNANKDGYGNVEVEINGNPRAVRIDPVTEYCILSNVKIEAITKAGKYSPEVGTNGYKIDDKTFLFNDPDTQFYIATDEKTKKVKMTYNIKVIDKSTADNIINEIENIKESNIRLNNTIAELNSTIIKKDNVINEKNIILEERDNCINTQNSEITRLNSIVLSKNNQINEIYNSTCWKITAPIRFIAGGTKKFLRNNAITGKGYEFLYYMRRFGYRTAVEHLKKANILKRVSTQVCNDVIGMESVVPLVDINKKIAVHLHLYYVDLIEEFWKYFNNIPFKFDLYVSCKSGSNIKEISKKFKTLKNVQNVKVEETINRGRDIAPLYVQFGKEIEQYDYFLHVHSKKSIYSGKEQYGWRQFSLDCLLGNEETIRKIFSLFESDKRIGLFYPETFGDMPIIAQDWLLNAGMGREFLNSMDIEFEDGFFNYPVGSFFWANTAALKPIFERKIKYEDFQEELGQTDGTLAHVLERAVSFVSKSRGFIDAIYDIKKNIVSLGKSYKLYENYFNTNIEDAKNYIADFDIVTFDIFDTLITRNIYMPDDIFNIMKLKIEKEFGIKCNYIEMRKKAEALAWEKKKEYTSINDIYAELMALMNISEEISEKIKRMEIELEFKLCVPRRDILEIFNYVKNQGKKIILISDMYLNKEIVSKILKNCGYEGYNELWISCDMGMRKDNGTMWNKFFSHYGAFKTIHVGDNPQSDIQAVIDRKRESFFVINPRTAFKMSKYYDTLKNYINGEIINSILLGMFINGGIYNSPFCQGIDGEPEINDYETMGYSAFGPLFSIFSLWINQVTDKNDVLMFLAREGYIFEQVYNNIYKHNESEKRSTVYFLASRRAVSVAAIRGRNEVESILAQYYRGSFSNLLKSRLGIELYSDIDDCHINMPEDLEKVMKNLEVYLEDIYNKAQEERENYLNYIKNLGIDNNGVVIDVGYSGTIQYYLAMLLESKLPGAYLSTSTNRKPEKLFCRCSSLYPLNDVLEEKTNKIFKNQLFLEAVLKAPYGQLISFENKEGKILPVYKNDNEISSELKELQNGILKYAEVFGSIIGNLKYKGEICSNIVADMFDICLTGGWMTEKIANIMSVQDDYCENGSHKFNIKSKNWDIIKK